MMNAIEALLSRVSVPLLCEPGPSPEQLEIILNAAVRAPDHGELRPWRFMIIGGQKRQRLGEIFCEAAKKKQGSLSTGEEERYLQMPFRAPCVIISIASISEHKKIPMIEQVISTGAAVQNLLIAAHAEGLGVMWRTGEMAYDEHVKAALGLKEMDHIVGFLYIGTPKGKVKTPTKLSAENFLLQLPENQS